MKYMRKRARYTWTEYKTSTPTEKDLNITSVFGQNTGMKNKPVATKFPVIDYREY
jgi:hypothetical protein